ncbi:hypothetical protein BGX21_002201 [Mortierella sp. AD011]|nr:hypothetical protein BGX20_001894 [Mortierella sp. AD010]KAF9381027.1 hypothetical protein BGX21_002201 [Mortierella sp. AD011]
MSTFDSEDPFDSGQQWQNVPTHSTWDNLTSTTAVTVEEETFIPEAPTTQLVQPSAPVLPHSIDTPTTATPPSEVETARADITEPARPAHLDDLPPSYEAAIIKDRPQIHDNYDHLRGPVSQRGVDIKTRIPLDSTPASHYQSGGSGSGSNGAGSSSRQEGQDGESGARYGSISPSRLHGQVSQGREDDELHSRDVDRLLGPSNDPNHAEYHNRRHEEPETGWGIVGVGRVWVGLAYLLVILFPWALFCFVWTIVTGLIAAITMIVPPIGYLFVIATITSWRALARVDIVVSRSLVTWHVREKHPHVLAKIFVRLPESHPAPLPPGTRRSRRKNLWQRGADHLKATIGNKHSFTAMSYFLIWKAVFALLAFPIVLVFSVLTIPFMVCLLPSLLIFCRMLINWQFQWAVFWLAEKKQPIALP